MLATIGIASARARQRHAPAGYMGKAVQPMKEGRGRPPSRPRAEGFEPRPHAPSLYCISSGTEVLRQLISSCRCGRTSGGPVPGHEQGRMKFCPENQSQHDYWSAPHNDVILPVRLGHCFGAAVIVCCGQE